MLNTAKNSLTFMRDYLTYRDDQWRWFVIANSITVVLRMLLSFPLLPDQLIQLSRPGFVHHPVRGLRYHFGRRVPDRDDVLPPIVHDERIGALRRQFLSEHEFYLRWRHRGVRAEGRDYLNTGRR